MKTIGSILLDVELVTQDDIDHALEIQKQTGQRLGEILVNLGGVSDDDIRWALAEQLNLPYVNIRKDQIDLDVATMIPEKLARRYHVIPILKIGDELTVVVDDPLNTTILKDIEAITRLQVKISLGRTSDIMMAIDEIYGRAEEELTGVQETPPRFLSPWFVDEDIQRILNDPSGYALLESVLAHAFAHGVSRIHFQPGTATNYISYRLHGVLQRQVELGKEWYSIALFRLKISAGIDISKVGYPTYREFSYWEQITETEAAIEDKHAKIAVSIIPTVAGEAATLYTIDKDITQVKDVEQTCAIPSFQQHELLEIGTIKAALRQLRAGAVFLTGSSYPDKIMVLYSLLHKLDPVQCKIVTLEAYTEYRTDQYYQIRYLRHAPWMTPNKRVSVSSEHAAPLEQLLMYETLSSDLHTEKSASGELSAPQVGHPIAPMPNPNPNQGILAGWLAMLNDQDADVTLIDQIESEMVLSQCLEYAAEHLMLGAFSLKSVFDMLAYCLECQIKPAILTSRTYALLAQHSVFLLCQECKQKDTSDSAKQLLDQIQADSGKPFPSAEIFVPGRCSACYGTGYTQQVMLFEVLRMEPWVKEMLLANTPLPAIKKAAEERGFSSLRQKSLELLMTGKTSLKQVLAGGI